MITGYYVRQRGERWQLIRQNERYEDEVLVDGLSSEEAVALYWRKMAELHAPAGPTAEPASAQGEPNKRPPPQLSLKL